MDAFSNNMGGGDWLVLAVYFLVIIGVGIWSGRGERDTGDFFLGGRRQNWFLVGLSILATEVSAVTFLIVPGNAFGEDWWYLQLYAGAFLGKILIVYLLLPAFYGGKVTTVYEYLGTRFGPATRITASLMFFASRILGSGIRLLAASLAIAIIFDCPLVWVVLIGASVAIFYATLGGIKSIIYTDAIQAVVLIGSGLAVIIFLFGRIPG
ncbi:MAG: sodium:solute symporter family transporter, partial [Planctomycetota bacterium]